MMSPVISSSSTCSPIWSTSIDDSAIWLTSAAYILSTSTRSFLTASTRFLSAGPGASCNGLIIDGFMGRVELGSRAVSQLPAGRSYHGVVGSPCIAGMTNGWSFTTLAPFPASSDPFLANSSARSCSTAARSFGMVPFVK